MDYYVKGPRGPLYRTFCADCDMKAVFQVKTVLASPYVSEPAGEYRVFSPMGRLAGRIQHTNNEPRPFAYSPRLGAHT